jgi:hypothetical protein
MVLDLLSSGAVSLTTVRLLQPHLTAENHEAVLARATHKRCYEIKALVAELAPQPDVPSSVRKLPDRFSSGARPVGPRSGQAPAPSPIFGEGLPFGEPTTSTPLPAPETSPAIPRSAGPAPMTGETPESPTAPGERAASAGPRSVVRVSAPERYRVQFTIGQETHDRLKQLQTLMRREIPTGDVAVIFDQAVGLLLEKVERAKLGAKARDSRRRRMRKGRATYENRIRFKTDNGGRGDPEVSGPTAAHVGSTDETSPRPRPSRHVPNAVKRAVWWRDRGRCAFVAETGHRCTQHAFLEIHHIQPFALAGPPTVGNLSLRCRRHNAYEAEVVFGTRRAGTVGIVP